MNRRHFLTPGAAAAGASCLGKAESVSIVAVYGCRLPGFAKGSRLLFQGNFNS